MLKLDEPRTIVRVYRDHAEFQFNSDRSQVIDASDADLEEGGVGEPLPRKDVWPELDYGPLTAGEAGGIVKALETATGKKLNRLQTLNVLRMLQSPHQRLLPRSSIQSPFASTGVDSDGEIVAWFPNGQAIVRRDGTVRASVFSMIRPTQPLIRVSAVSCQLLNAS
jgi:hypothetical protein